MWYNITKIYRTDGVLMLRSNRDKQQNYEFVSIEDLVPADHMN
jgi:hypothetical protein